VGYVLKMFPRFSETFVLREMLELERRGARLVAFSLKPPDEPLWQPGLERLAAPILVIPRLAGAGLLAHLWSHAWCCARRPRRYAAALRFARGRRSRSAWRKFLLAAWVAREGERRGVRHFHAHFASGPARLAKFASLLGGAPFSFTAHAKDLYWAGHQHGRNHKLKKRVRLAAFVASISDCNRRFIEGLGFKVPRRRLVTIYNGLDLEEWRWERPAGRPLVAEDPPLLLAVGRLVEKKGFHDLVEACARLRERGVAFRCVIAGAGPQRPSLEAHVRAQGLEPWVELPGPVPQDRLRALFRRAAALVQPSLVGADGDRDGIPTVILEAMALGLPVVATPVSGIGEAITHGESGLLSPPRDPGGLAEAIRAVLADEGLCARLSAAARARMEERFDLRRNAEELLRLMKRAARMPVRAGARTEAGPAPAAAGGARR
jgi:glycosyltransferase involved in cell wall biosynthesis